MVCADATETDSLFVLGEILEEVSGIENAIVGMVVFDVDALRASELFEGVLGLDCFFSIRGFVYVDITETRGVIHKYSGDAVALLGELADILCDKAWDGGDHLVHRYAVARLGGQGCNHVGGCPRAPGTSLGRAVEAAGAFRVFGSYYVGW